VTLPDTAGVLVGPETLKWMVGAIITIFGGMFAVLGIILRLAHNLGKDSEKIATGLQKLDKFESIIGDIPIIKVRVGQLEELVGRNRSDIKDLLKEKRISYPDPNERNGR